MKKALLVASTCLLAVAPLAGSRPKPLAPHETIQETVRALRHNDLKTLIEVTAGPQVIAEMRRSWQAQRERTPTEREMREFAQAVAFLTADGAEDRIMALVRPKLAELRPQWSMTSAMVTGMIQSAVEMDQKMDPVEKEQARRMMQAVTSYVQRTDFLSEELAERSVGILCQTARRMQIHSFQDIQSLELEQLLVKGGSLMASFKDVLRVYGMDVNSFLDTVRAETVYEAGDKAKVKLSFEFQGKRESTTAEMVKVDGRWISKDSVDKAANLVPMGR